MRALHKDSSGYSLRDLFIGSEGTLGVITTAILKLLPCPTARATAFVAVRDDKAALCLLALIKNRCGDRVTAFEFMTGACLDLVARHVEGARIPFEIIPETALLVQLSDTVEETALREILEQALAEADEAGLVQEAVIAQNTSQMDGFWHVRGGISGALVAEGRVVKLDLSIPIDATVRFAAAARTVIDELEPGARPIVFGHLGDGNLHFNILPPPGTSDEGFDDFAERLTQALHDEVIRLGGSICAEHGIGQTRVAELQRTKNPLEMELMASLKNLFDPRGLLNPGKLLPIQ